MTLPQADLAERRVIRTNSPQRVPGAHVPEPRTAREAGRASASAESQYRQRARRTAERPQDRGYGR